MISLMSSGSSRVESAVEPTRSQNMTVSRRRSADAATGVIGEAAANSVALQVVGALAVRSLPHSAQNLAFGRFALPQEGQRASSAAPQAMQNLPVSGVSEWQFGHSMSAPYPTSRVYCFRVIVARQAGTEMRAAAFLSVSAWLLLSRPTGIRRPSSRAGHCTRPDAVVVRSAA